MWVWGVLCSPVCLSVNPGDFVYITYTCTVLVGLFAGSDTKDRAVLTGLRNFLRDMGGAVGVTGTDSIYSTRLRTTA